MGCIEQAMGLHAACRPPVLHACYKGDIIDTICSFYLYSCCTETSNAQPARCPQIFSQSSHRAFDEFVFDTPNLNKRQSLHKFSLKFLDGWLLDFDHDYTVNYQNLN